MKSQFKVGQVVKNKRSKLIRRVTKDINGMVSYLKKQGGKGRCSEFALARWIAGKDL